MQTTFPDEVRAFGATAQRRLEQVGGVRAALAAETDRQVRDRVGSALTEIGVDDLDVRAGADELLAGAVVCRVAGSLALPWPVVESLLQRDDSRLALIDLHDPRVDHGDLGDGWVGCDLDGQAHELVPGAPGPSKLSPFLVACAVGARRPDVGADDVARHLVLGSWRILGSLDTALKQVVAHLRARVQFGRPLSEFQAIRFTVADATVAMRGLEELAKFTTWRLGVAGAAEGQADAIALRLHSVETARLVMRTAHQLFGALGFCDETDVSVLNRHLQPSLCLPIGPEQLALRLNPALRSGQWKGLF
jgi:hypothetical protein